MNLVDILLLGGEERGASGVGDFRKGIVSIMILISSALVSSEMYISSICEGVLARKFA